MFEYVLQRVFLRNSSGSNYPTGRRYSCIEAPFMIGSALSHTSLAGVAGGMIAGNPVARSNCRLFGWCALC